MSQIVAALSASRRVFIAFTDGMLVAMQEPIAGSRVESKNQDCEEKMDPKLAIFVVLIGSIIAMSHLDAGRLARMRRQFTLRHWRASLPSRRKA